MEEDCHLSIFVVTDSRLFTQTLWKMYDCFDEVKWQCRGPTSKRYTLCTNATTKLFHQFHRVGIVPLDSRWSSVNWAVTGQQVDASWCHCSFSEYYALIRPCISNAKASRAVCRRKVFVSTSVPCTRVAAIFYGMKLMVLYFNDDVQSLL